MSVADSNDVVSSRVSSSSTTTHTPTEIAAVLDAVRTPDEDGNPAWRRVVAVVQPHRYSRLEQQLDEYRDLFSGRVDHLVVTEVYPAGEPRRPDVSARTSSSSSAPPIGRPR
ncbi:MAG: cyanophycin synthetase [Microthrixaceae bacterium]